MNDNGPSGTDFETRETDVWIGATYSSGIYSISGTFQSWQYASDTEYVFDLGISFDTFLSPSLTFHKRVSSGGAATYEPIEDPNDPTKTIDGPMIGGFNGTMLVGGLEHSFDLSDTFSVTIPVNIGIALDEFHTTESGYAYGSVGLQASYTLSESTSFNFGVSYYDTDDEVVGNKEDSFLTYNAGVSFSF